MPAVSQGAIAIETREIDAEVDELMAKVNHVASWNAIIAERAFLAHLEGGCQVPLGCYSRIENNHLVLSGFVASVDGKQYIKETISGEIERGAELGIEMAVKMLERGAHEILSQIKSIHNTH